MTPHTNYSSIFIEPLHDFIHQLLSMICSYNVQGEPATTQSIVFSITISICLGQYELQTALVVSITLNMHHDIICHSL